MLTNWNYRVLETSTVAIFLPNDPCLYARFTSNECHACFHLYGTSRPARSASKATTYVMKILAHSRTRTYNFYISSEVLFWLSYRTLMKADLLKYMYFRYQRMNGIKLENNKVEPILSCTWAVLCDLLEYIYIGQNSKTTHMSCVCFQHAKHTKHAFCLYTYYVRCQEMNTLYYVTFEFQISKF